MTCQAMSIGMPVELLENRAISEYGRTTMHIISKIVAFLRQLARRDAPVRDPLSDLTLRERADLPPWHETPPCCD
jgi:hypothetical protein